MMGWGNDGWGAGEWVAMSVLMVLFWGGLIALGVWVAGRLRSDSGKAPNERAAALLAERFARGDIDAEEFARSRELLRTSASSISLSGR